MRKQVAFISVLLVTIVISGYPTGAGLAQVGSTPTTTTTPAPSPPPPPTVPAAPDVSGTWDVTRSWLRRCPKCMEPVIRGTRWEITQVGHELRVDRGLRGTIEGYDIHLEGIETNGFDRFDFYYSRLRLSPDGLFITGQFAGSETIQNPCTASLLLVTCFASAGDFYAIRRSPVPTLPPTLTPIPTSTETPTPTSTSTDTPMPTPTDTPPPTPSATATPTEVSVGPSAVHRRYLPLIAKPAPLDVP